MAFDPLGLKHPVDPEAVEPGLLDEVREMADPDA